MNKLTYPLPAIPYFIAQEAEKHRGDILLVTGSEEEAYLRAKQIAFFYPCSYFPAFDNLPYDRTSPSAEVMAERAQLLAELSVVHRQHVIVTSSRNLLQRVPPKEEFSDSVINISCATFESSPREVIVAALIKNGFHRKSCASEAGDFSMRGEILDVVTADMKGFRLNFAWDKLESIKLFDPISQVSHGTTDSMTIYPSGEFNMSASNIARFKDGFLTNFGVNHMRHPLYTAILEGRNFAGMESLTPLLYEKMSCFLSYLNAPRIIFEPLALRAMSEAEENFADFYESRIESNKGALAPFYAALPTAALYYTRAQIEAEADDASIVEHGESEIKTLGSLYHESAKRNMPIAELFDEFIDSHKEKRVVICCSSQSAIDRIGGLLSLKDASDADSRAANSKIRHGLSITIAPLQGGFIAPDTIYLSQYDLLGEKFTAATPSGKG